MKEFELLAGESIQQIFLEAWEYHLKNNEPVTFIHNRTRILIMEDTSNSETAVIAYNDREKVEERAILVPKGYQVKVWKARKEMKH